MITHLSSFPLVVSGNLSLEWGHPCGWSQPRQVFGRRQLSIHLRHSRRSVTGIYLSNGVIPAVSGRYLILDAGFRPGNRGTFFAEKVPKALEASSGFLRSRRTQTCGRWTNSRCSNRVHHLLRASFHWTRRKASPGQHEKVLAGTQPRPRQGATAVSSFLLLEPASGSVWEEVGMILFLVVGRRYLDGQVKKWEYVASMLGHGYTKSS